METLIHTRPRIIVSGISGGSGKTLLSLGLVRAFCQQGMHVQPYKKGPDYIDAAWLSRAAGRACACLDPFFLSSAQLRQHFCHEFFDADLAVIEGNRGLFDGRDVQGSCSTAQVALDLSCPVIVAINCTKMTRTAAAVVAGIAAFEPKLCLAGVVLNQVGSARHASMVRRCIEQYTDVCVLGELPRLPENPIPERHMGLVFQERASADDDMLNGVAEYVRQHVNLSEVLESARAVAVLSEGVSVTGKGSEDCVSVSGLDHQKDAVLHTDCTQCVAETAPIVDVNASVQTKKPRIAYVFDDALWFYYKENFEALEQAGAELIRLSILDPAPWLKQSAAAEKSSPFKELAFFDALYLGGGFPELFAKQIVQSGHLAEIRQCSEQGMPIYAECGGFMVLCRALQFSEKSGCRGTEREVPMAGIFPVSTRFYARPQGLGYVEACAVRPNPYHPLGKPWRGHEFHYSRCEGESDFVLALTSGHGMKNLTKTADRKKGESDGTAPDYACADKKAAGAINSVPFSGLDGLCVRRTFASYTHLFAPAVPHWAINFVAAARSWQKN